jgi:hypothetical protein
VSKKNAFSRRDFVRSGALLAAACAAPRDAFSMPSEPASTDEAPPIRLGLASYTFRNFSRGQIIAFMKQLSVFELNAKDVKDHSRWIRRRRRLRWRTTRQRGSSFTPPEPSISREMKMRTSGLNSNTASEPVLPLLWPATRHRNLCRELKSSSRSTTSASRSIITGLRISCGLRRFESKESQVAVGDGLMPVRKMFEALIAIKYNGFVDLEYEIRPDDPMPGVMSSFAYMRGVLAGMAYAIQDVSHRSLPSV